MNTWTRTRLDRVATVNARIGWKALTAQEYQSDGYAFLATPNIKSESIDFDNVNYISQFRFEESPELKLRKGDVLLAKDGSTLGIANVVRDLPRAATVNGSIAVLRAFDIEPRYLMYVMRGNYVQEWIGQVKDGMGVPHLFQADIKKFVLPKPPTEAQRRIADFLDDQVTRIDKMIDARQSQLDLLDQARWSSFSVELAAAGARMTPLRRIITLIADGPFGSAFSSSDYVDDGPAAIRLGNIGFAEFRANDLARIPRAIYSSFPRCRVAPGDLLIASLGDDRNHAGRACLAPHSLGEAMVKGKCFRAQVSPRLGDAQFIAVMLSSPLGADLLARSGRGATRTMLNIDVLLSVAFPMPDVKTQRRILANFAEQSDRAQRAIAGVRASISLMQELKRSLITAAVTGEFDVSSADGSRVPV